MYTCRCVYIDAGRLVSGISISRPHYGSHVQHKGGFFSDRRRSNNYLEHCPKTTLKVHPGEITLKKKKRMWKVSELCSFLCRQAVSRLAGGIYQLRHGDWEKTVGITRQPNLYQSEWNCRRFHGDCEWSKRANKHPTMPFLFQCQDM